MSSGVAIRFNPGTFVRPIALICPTGNPRMRAMRNLPVAPFCRIRRACADVSKPGQSDPCLLCMGLFSTFRFWRFGLGATGAIHRKTIAGRMRVAVVASEAKQSSPLLRGAGLTRMAVVIAKAPHG
jgi:hypothetical protein